MQPTRKFATKTRTEWSQTSDFISKKSKKSWTKRYRPPWRKWSTMLWNAELWANRCLIQSARESSCWDLGVSRSSVVWLLARSKDKTLESPVAFCGMKNTIRGSMLCLKVLNCSRLQLSMASIKNNFKIALQFENSLNNCIIGFWESSCLITGEIASILLVGYSTSSTFHGSKWTTSLYCLQVHIVNLFADLLRNIFAILQPYLYHNSQIVFGLI